MTIAQRVNRIDCRSSRAGKGGRGKKGRRLKRCFDGGSSLTERRLVTFNLFFTFCGGTNRRERCVVLVAGTKIAAHRASPPVRIVFPRNKIQGFLSKRDRSITSVPPLPTSLSHRSFKPSRDYAINPTKKRNINRKKQRQRE